MTGQDGNRGKTNSHEHYIVDEARGNSRSFHGISCFSPMLGQANFSVRRDIAVFLLKPLAL